MLSLKNVNVKNKAVLIRIDINTTVLNRKARINDRFIEHAKTIKYLIKNKAKVTILAHQGRKGNKKFTTLEQHAKILTRLVRKKIKYVPDLFGREAIKAIKNLKPGQALLLENVRQLDEETKNISATEHAKSLFVRTLAPLFDIYVLDTFSVAHRSHASLVGFPSAIKKRKGKVCAGPVLERELKGLEKLRKKLKKKYAERLVYVLAGAKLEEDLILLREAKKQKATILLGGTFCLVYLAAIGKELGFSDELLKKHNGILADLQNIKAKNLVMPVDFAIENKGKRKEISLNDLPINKPLLDLGSHTIKLYEEKLKKAKIIIVKGPLGKYEDPLFGLATKEIYKAVSKSKAYTVLGGGHTLDALKRFRIKKNKFNYASLGGGALLRYLIGQKLPAVVAIS